MNNESVTRQKLRELGLGKYEANSYLTLLSHTSPTATEISKLSGVPRQKVYEALESLHNLGLCSIITGRAKHYEATPPAEAFTNLSEKIKREAALKSEKAREMALIAASLCGKAERDTGLMPQIEISKSRDLVKRLYFKLMNLSKREILAFHKPPFVVHPHDLEQKKDALKRGVSMRVIYERLAGADEQRSLEREIEKRRKAGEKSKLAGSLPMKLLVVDDSYVLVALEHAATDAPSCTSMAIRHQGLAKALKTCFEVYWKESDK